MEIKRINDHVSVSGQISPDDIPALKAAGFTTIVNNRPDGEAPDQPSGAEIEAAAKAAGLAYHCHSARPRRGFARHGRENPAGARGEHGSGLLLLPVGNALDDALGAEPGRQAGCAEIISAAQNAGYDMSHLAGHLGQN